MKSEDALQFVQERLRHRASPLYRELHLQTPARVKRRFAVEMDRGSDRALDHVDRSVLVCCIRGSVWITQDGDPKDVILYPGDSCRAGRAAAMHLLALEPCVLEIEFEDEVPLHH